MDSAPRRYWVNVISAELKFIFRTMHGDRRPLGKSLSQLAKTIIRAGIFLPGIVRLWRDLSGDRFLPIRQDNAGLFLKHLRKGYAIGLSTDDRARIAAHHYQRTADSLGTNFLRESMRDGVLLWSATDDPDGPRILAQGADQYDYESEMNLLFMYGTDVLYKMGCVISPGDVWDIDESSVIVVTRVHGGHVEMSRMKSATELTGDCAPRILLFAAIEGIAAVLRINRIVGISARRQIASAFATISTPSFVSNYDGFWESLNAESQPDRSYLLPLPVAHRPLTAMPAKHRNRAHKRRIYRAMLTSQVASLFV